MEDKIKKELETLKETISTMEQVKKIIASQLYIYMYVDY